MLTHREPTLSIRHTAPGSWKLSPRRLGTLLNVLPAEAISTEAAAEMLHHQDFYVRFNAAKVLGKRGDREARQIMAQALQMGNAPTRASVARHLHGFSWYSAEPLLHQALADNDPRVQEGAIYALCDFASTDAYALLTQRLHNANDALRAAAAWGLRETHDPQAVPVLAEALRADDPDVRGKVLEALGTNGTGAAVAPTRQALDDSDPYVQYTAAQSLLELLEEEAIPELTAKILDTHGEGREAIIRGFFHATNYLGIPLKHHLEAVLSALAVALSDPLPAVRLQAIYPLAWIQDPLAADLIWMAYQAETESETKAQMLRVACSLMSEVSHDLLQDALHSLDETIYEMAIQMQHVLAHG